MNRISCVLLFYLLKQNKNKRWVFFFFEPKCCLTHQNDQFVVSFCCSEEIYWVLRLTEEYSAHRIIKKNSYEDEALRIQTFRSEGLMSVVLCDGMMKTQSRGTDWRTWPHIWWQTTWEAYCMYIVFVCCYVSFHTVFHAAVTPKFPWLGIKKVISCLI